MTSLENEYTQSLSADEIRARLCRLCFELDRSRIAYTQHAESGVLTVHDVATVRAPYYSHNVLCANPIVLERLTKIIDSLPTTDSSTPPFQLPP